MKIVLGSLVSIFIREEDFTEVNVGQEEVTYLRPEGTRATIKFSQTVSAPKAINEDKDVRSAKKSKGSRLQNLRGKNVRKSGQESRLSKKRSSAKY